jgi:proteasome alpha subunit
VLKGAFEQVYAAPYLARMLFAEIGQTPDDDLFLRVDYDGAIATNGGTFGDTRQHFGALSGTRGSTDLMESFLKQEHSTGAKASLQDALLTGVNAWIVGNRALGSDGATDVPTTEQLAQEREKQLSERRIEAAILERNSGRAIRYRALRDDELKSLAKQ